MNSKNKDELGFILFLKLLGVIATFGGIYCCIRIDGFGGFLFILFGMGLFGVADFFKHQMRE